MYLDPDHHLPLRKAMWLSSFKSSSENIAYFSTIFEKLPQPMCNYLGKHMVICFIWVFTP